jgi:aspartate aminotransferase
MTFSKDRLAELAKVARERHLLVLSDEIYGKLHHDGEHHSIVPLLPERTIFSGGLSKWCGAGGWRLGLFVFPKSLGWLREAIAAVATETFTSTSAPIQYAAVRAFQGGQEIEEYLEQSRRVLRAVGCRTAELLEQAGARLHKPQGGFYHFPDFTPLQDNLHRRGIQTSALLCERLLEQTGVAILPGVEFGRPAEELTARLAYVDFDGSAALEAARRIPPEQMLDDRFADRHCRSVVEAVSRLCEWVVGSG